MRWDHGLGDLFEDLEQQAEGLRLAERDAEISDRSTSEYAEVTLAARIHASTSHDVRLFVQGVGAVDGTLLRAGLDWCLVGSFAPNREWVIRLPAVQSAAGLSERAVSEAARPAVTRLGMGSVLRRVAESRRPVVLTHLDGRQTQGELLRVGADFVEVVNEGEGRRRGTGRVVVVPFAAVAALHAR